ncbi:hypothetical protein AK812_SmicGene656 [Symbiodinium microadriaticum]|uniref:Uncharacterized protein n=1 Tax=Symbiodinium microadriaticum TaxID=2951 RepID=A0A1Q9F612_SYMMI|nr:hypothetical protein AK812_SmicGene656 [Symbiodinium microadriaticum]
MLCLYRTVLLALLALGVSGTTNRSARVPRVRTGPRTLDALANTINIDLDTHRVTGQRLLIVGVLKTLDHKTEGQISSALKLCTHFQHSHCGMMLMSSKVDKSSLTHIRQKIGHATLEVMGDVHVSGPRTAKLAGLRNAMLDAASKRPWDFLMVTDLDNTVIWDSQTYRGILNALDHQKLWDGVTFAATQYYDWWAARCSKNSPNCVAHRSCHEKADYPCIVEAMADSNPDHFYPVRSAFNGVALYKRDAIGKCRYSGKNTDKSAPGARQDCEHVTFHDCIAAKGKRIRISSGRLHVFWSNFRKKKHQHKKSTLTAAVAQEGRAQSEKGQKEMTDSATVPRKIGRARMTEKLN